MYEQFFNLTEEPFRLSPDHRFCYSHSLYFKAKAYMAFAFMRAEGFVMVTGPPGTGKTTLIGDLIESLADENVVVANLVSTQLVADDLLRMVAFAFGVPADTSEKSAVLQQLNNRFLSLHREGGRALLIVDEAQALPPKAMEELRLLTNLQEGGKPLVQIFLLGQTELRERVHEQGLEQVHQRIIAASHLEALKEHETREYVEHRLKVVGWRNDPAISSAVYPIIHLFSEGVPRRINLICSRLFLQCFVGQRHRITVADARSAVQELQEEQLTTRNLLNDDLFFAQDSFDEPDFEESQREEPSSEETLHEKPPFDESPQQEVTEDILWQKPIPRRVCQPDESSFQEQPRRAIEQHVETLVSDPVIEKMPPCSGVDEAPLVKKVAPKACVPQAQPGPAISTSKPSPPEPAPKKLSVPVRKTRGKVRTLAWFALFLVLLAGGSAIFLTMNEGYYTAIAERLEPIYTTLASQVEHIWCRLPFAC